MKEETEPAETSSDLRRVASAGVRIALHHIGAQADTILCIKDRKHLFD